MSNTSTEYGYSFSDEDGWDVTVEIKVRFNEERVQVDAFELDEAANDAVEYVRVRAVMDNEED